MRTLLIDNYDSYTYNLYQMIAQITGEEPIVVHNDSMSWDEVKRNYAFECVVISPGPGRPDQEQDFGVCAHALREMDLPILGICLGHQGMGWVNGANVIASPEIAHGVISDIYHSKDSLFAGIPAPFQAVRYHSLLIEDHLPNELKRIAWTRDGLNMGIRHSSSPHWGVQFHPESICSEYGTQLITNFLNEAKEWNSIKEQSNFSTMSVGQELLEDLQVSAADSSLQVALDSDNLNVFYRILEHWQDTDTVFMQLYAQSRHAFWLDSSRQDGNMSRFSYMGDDQGPRSYQVSYNAAVRVVTEHRCQEDTPINLSIIDYLNESRFAQVEGCRELPFDFQTGYVGYFGYDCLEQSSTSIEPKGYDDVRLLFADQMLAFDHQDQHIYVLCLAHNEHEAELWFDQVEAKLELIPTPSEFVSTISEFASVSNSLHKSEQEPLAFHWAQSYPEYMANIEQVKTYLRAGDTYEINLTNELTTQVSVHPLELYMNLRRVNPAPYAAYLSFGELHIHCSSPERFLRLDRERILNAKPIKGTIGRGRSTEEDEQCKELLRNSPKNRSENLMIVDLLRNDIGSICITGSVHVPELMQIETFETVHQMVSTIEGSLKPEISIYDALRKVFPGGSMTGAPKKRSMEIIRELEGRRRGIYSGSIGFVSVQGSADLNIVIRTIVQEKDRLTIGVGGAIVIDSDPNEEYEEILLKARALVEAIHHTSGRPIHVDDSHVNVDQAPRFFSFSP
ncbi:para-aminobenzoate synthetase [Paenibacillus shirakamiensis]|uniref:aminodeoxychorismate synthase n=1 Tax=Paenibacillus shirakamiensis TaxID=1265935 RepID=A0ABS4JHN7_9BACL|nr:aminodeoxychorismate synthase component I [Paenibacillus shirakamiensis]MBP2001240.1 para-aminobenzoate synthetase [Paenibacillus shirakamiensis]